MAESQNIYQRLNAVRSSVGYLQKDSEVQGYRAVTHDLVTSAVREHLINQGIMVVPRQTSAHSVHIGETKSGAPIIRYEAWYEIDFINCDNPDDKVTIPQQAHANDHGDKAPGKACSYAVKYAMLKLFSIETGENEESRVDIAKGRQPVDDEQAQAIENRIAEVGADRTKFLRYFEVTDVSQIPSSLYDYVMKALDKKEEVNQQEANTDE